MDFALDARTEELREELLAFMDSYVYPAEPVFAEQLSQLENRWAWDSVPVLAELRAERVRLVSSGPNSSVVELELGEGKNREVRRLFESQHLTVKKLQRTQIGKIKLGELKPGKWRTLTEAEIKTLISDL